MKISQANNRISPLFSFIRTALLITSLIGGSATLASAGNGANFVLYNHHTAKEGEVEVMLMNDFGENPDGIRYNAQMLEIEWGITNKLTTEFMLEGYGGNGNYNSTGFRWENRYRPFDYGTFLNPVIYIEYESLSEDTKYIMEMSGREDARPTHKKRPRERVLETRLILGEDISNTLNVSFNWLNESDLDTGVTAFGYAAGLNYTPKEKITLGLEIYGGLGDSDKGITTNSSLTQHYLAPNIVFKVMDNIKIKVGGAIGLTNVSQDIVRFAISYEL